jgi:hypothetical protein
MPLTQEQREAIVRVIQERKRKQAEEEAAKPSLLERGVPLALRVGGGVGGALIGSALAPGVGTLAGGGVGAGLGEWGAQAFEQATGQREDISPTGIAIEGALGAVPLGKATGLARAAGQGALLAGGGHVARKVLDEGEAPGLETLPIAALGAVLGGGAHGAFKALGKLGRRPTVPPPAVDEVDELATRYAGLGGEPPPRSLADVFRTPPAPSVPLRQGLPDLVDEVVPPPRVPPTDDLLTQGFPEGIIPEQALARRTGYDLTAPLDLAPPVHYPQRPVGLLPARTRGGTAREPVVNELPAGTIPRELPATPLSPADSVATDLVGSPRPGLTGLFDSQDARIRANAPVRPVEAPEIPTPPRSPEPEIASGASSVPAGATETGPTVPAELAAFLKGNSRGVTLAVLKKKFGPKIEAVIEQLAQSGKLRWGGKEGAEKFSLAAGYSGNELTQMLGGATVGGAVGASQGETPGERITYGLMGAGAGAAGGAQLGKFLERRRLGPNPSKVAEAILGSAPATKAGEPIIPAAARVPTDQKIPVIGGRTLSSQQGDVPLAFINQPKGPPIAPGKQPKARYEQAGFNLNIFPEEIRPFIQTHVVDDAMRVVAEQQRRGRISIPLAEQRGRGLYADLVKKLKPGTMIKPEEALALGHMEVGLLTHSAEQFQKARATGDMNAVAEAVKTLMQARTLSAGRIGAMAEAGRTLRYAQELRKLQMPIGQRLVSEAQKQGRLSKVMGDFESLMAQVPEDPVEAAQFLSKHMEAGTFDKLTSYFMANILSAIPSYIRNGIGSAVNSVSRVAIKGALAGPVDALLSKLTGRQRAIYSSEVLHDIAGASYAAKQGLDDAWSTFRTGFSTKAINEGIEFGELSVPKVEFTGGLLNPWNQPGRILESTDRFFQTFNQAMSKNSLIWARAQREADANGLVGKAFDDFMEKRMSQLQTDEFIRGQAVEIGREQAFREDPGKIANTLIGMKKHAPVLQYIIPFVKTVSNIFRQGIEHSPIAPILSKTRGQMFPDKAGMTEAEAWMADRKQSEAFAKWAFGLASMVPIGIYAGTGKLSGSGPSDPAKRAALYEQGWRPNSIKIGDKWYTYSTWQPLSIPMAMIANAFEAYEDSVDSFTKEGKDTDWEKVAASTAFKVLNSATQQSYMQGVMALSAAMEDPDRFGENFLRQMAQGFYPMSGLQRTVARAVDPNIRENKTVQESLQRITPGISDELPSRLNRWGEDVQYSGGPVWRAVGGPVFGGEGTKSDPVNDELMRLKIDVGLPTERVVIGGKRVELERERGHELRQLKGKLVRQELERLILSPGFSNLPDPIKRERIEDTLARVQRGNSKRVRVGLQTNPNDFLSLLRERAANRG